MPKVSSEFPARDGLNIAAQPHAGTSPCSTKGSPAANSNRAPTHLRPAVPAKENVPTLGKPTWRLPFSSQMGLVSRQQPGSSNGRVHEEKPTRQPSVSARYIYAAGCG